MNMPDFSRRENLPEMMDDMELGGELMDQTLRQLGWINFWLGGRKYLWGSLKQLLELRTDKKKAVHILDLGCGGGDEMRYLCRKARKRKIPVRISGLDANPHVIEFAQRQSAGFPELSFQALDVMRGKPEDFSCDIAICSLFLHHFSNEEIVEILKKLANNVNIGLVISDLHRYWLAYYAFGIATRLMGASYMIRHDGLLSIRKSFSRSEIRQLLEKAGFRHIRIRWRWAFRFQVTAQK